LTYFQTFFGYFHVFQVVVHIRDSFRIITLKNETFEKNPKLSFLVNFANFSHNLWSKNHVLKKVSRGSSHDLFSNWYFLNLHALGYSKPVTVILYIKFGSTSPSAWCGALIKHCFRTTKMVTHGKIVYQNCPNQLNVDRQYPIRGHCSIVTVY
jgi:hypothetical protein